MTTTVNDDLNATIVSAVNARVTAEVAEVLAGNQFISKLVQEAVSRPIEVTQGYKTVKTTFLTEILRKTIDGVVREAVKEAIQEELPRIKDEVRKAVKRNADKIANTLAEQVVNATEKPYGIKVEMSYPS